MKRREDLELTLEDCFQKRVGRGRGGRAGGPGEGSCHSHGQPCWEEVSGKMSSTASDEDGKTPLDLTTWQLGDLRGIFFQWIHRPAATVGCLGS